MAEAITLHIEGMTCTSCAEHVQQALKNGVFVKVCGRREVLTMAHTVYRS